MLAVQGIGDWIEGIIVLVIIAGSALSGIGKMIVAKINRSREEAEAQGERRERPSPRVTDRPAPPFARPMPSRPRPQTITQQRPVARPLAPPRPQAEVPRTLPPAVQTIFDAVLGGAVDVEEVLRGPQPRPHPSTLQPFKPSNPLPPAAPRPAKTRVPKPVVRRRTIEDREENKAKLVDKRIGHVESHVASATPLSSTDADSDLFERPTRKDLRRAIILNEILSPPLALRRPA